MLLQAFNMLPEGRVHPGHLVLDNIFDGFRPVLEVLNISQSRIKSNLTRHDCAGLRVWV